MIRRRPHIVPETREEVCTLHNLQVSRGDLTQRRAAAAAAAAAAAYHGIGPSSYFFFFSSSSSSDSLGPVQLLLFVIPLYSFVFLLLPGRG